MSGPNAVIQVIAEIESKKSLYYIAKLMRRTYTQVKRMKEKGRCQPYEYDMLIEIRDDVVPRETSQNVSNKT